MIVTLTAVILTAGAAHAWETGRSAPVASMNRLARMYTVTAPGDTAIDPPMRARLAALVAYLNRYEARRAAGGSDPAEWFNYLQVIRDMTSAGADLCPLPEEALSWYRVGLDLSLAHERSVAVREGQSPARDQARAQIEWMRTQYAAALARCTAR